MSLFMSDNVTPACPEVVEAVIEANTGAAASYGDDAWSLKLHTRLCEIFETDLAVFPVITGTVSNALALAALTPPFGKIYCHELSHINTDECNAPELFTGGAKLTGIPGRNGKLTAGQLAGAVRGRGNVHHAQPSTLSITQACESGVVYQIDEIAALASTAHENGLKVHMDGARFANALVTLDTNPADMTWKSGVDVLSFGGTKNGCFAAEAVIFFDPAMAENFEYLHKRSGQLLSKLRFVASQLVSYVSDEVWLRNAMQANQMARCLSEGLTACAGIELAYPTESNEVFVRVPAPVIESLKGDGFEINEDELDGSAVRFVTAWNTEPRDVDRMLAACAKHCQR